MVIGKGIMRFNGVTTIPTFSFFLKGMELGTKVALNNERH